jgi:hypothetical protein
MPAVKTPAESDKLPGSPHDSAPQAARERREAERLITDWKQETTQLGRALALMTLDVSAMPSEKWAHRFIISLRPVVEDCVLLFYGAKFAALMELPEKARSFRPYGRAIAGEVCAGIHEGVHRCGVAERTRPAAGCSRP